MSRSPSHRKPGSWPFLALLDSVILALSPMTLIAFIVLCIILFDGFGSHVQFVRAMEENGVAAIAIWQKPDPQYEFVILDLEQADHGISSVTVYTKYYSPETFAALKAGQRVRVRYTYPPEYESKAVLADAFGEVKGYTGYISDIIWPILICWLLLALRPDFVYFGLLRGGKLAGEQMKQEQAA